MASTSLAGKPRRRNDEKSLGRRIRDNIWSYIFVAPAVIGMLMFAIYPIPSSVRYAFYNWNGIGEPSEFVGWRHFITVATDPFFWQAFRHTAIYTAVLVPVQLILTLALALVLNNPKLPLRNLFRTIYFLPIVTSILVVGVVMRFMLQALGQNLPQFVYDTGLVNPVLGFLSSPRWALPSIIAVGIWHSFGYNLIFFSGGAAIGAAGFVRGRHARWRGTVGQILERHSSAHPSGRRDHRVPGNYWLNQGV